VVKLIGTTINPLKM
jgi:hypothetical protein